MTPGNMVVLPKLILFFVQENDLRGFSAIVKLRSGQHRIRWPVVGVASRDRRPILEHYGGPESLLVTTTYDENLSPVSRGFMTDLYRKTLKKDLDDFEVIENALA